ncbi:MAG: SRPBCC family protein [Deltaproteobacteria bacterium]|nr:SRPBCC family protein [Deltaproteobacteria bacterium]
MSIYRLTRLLLAYALLALVVCSSARAEKATRHDARTDPLRGLRTLELMVLAPYLEKGPVALVEFADNSKNELPAINLATYVNASSAKIVELISDPRAYPEFMKTIDSVKLVSKHGATLVYDWSWKLSLFRLRGRNTMTLYTPPANRPNIGYRITIDSNAGDLGQGRVSMRIVPVAPNKSLLAISVRLDMRKANYVVREMAVASNSINRSANILLSCSTLLSLQQEVERRAGHVPRPEKAPDLAKPDLVIDKLLPLLGRGDLLLFDMHGAKLNQITVVGRINIGKVTVKDVMMNVHAFGSALVPGSYVKVVSYQDERADFDWGIDLPLVDVEGKMRIQQQGDIVAIDAISGALSGGRWRFDTTQLAKNSSVVVGWTSFDMKNSTWLLEYLISIDPNIGHGLTAAADIMVIRSLRTRAEKTAKRLSVKSIKTATVSSKKKSN